MDLAEVKEIKHTLIGNRNVWMWRIDTTIGEYFIVQYEEKGLEITDAYAGRFENKAIAAYNRSLRKVIREES